MADKNAISKVVPRPVAPIFHYSGTFHQNMRAFLIVAQVFAFFPVNGISAPTSSSLYYSFYSFRNFYSIFIIASNLGLASVIFYWNVMTGYSFDKIFPLIWFLANPFVIYQFIQMARKWPSLIRHWEDLEINTTIRDANVHREMRQIIMSASIGVPILAAIEHLLSLGNNVSRAMECRNATDTLNAYFRAAFPALFYYIEVSYFSGICAQLVNLFATFAWSMTDIFILLVSLGLITQLKHFNKHFEILKGRPISAEFMGRQRTYFTKLTQLLDHVNKDLATLILTSFSVNIFYICVQLFESVNSDESFLRRLYFWYSLIFLVGKTFLVSMVATLIHDQAKKPIKVLESIPATAFGSEAARFMNQLTSSTIALGGMQFFFITRSFIISVAGTIATYEIVLMQFKRRPGLSSLNC